MIKLSEDSMSKPGWAKLDNKQLTNLQMQRKKFSKEIKSATSVNTLIDKKAKQLYSDMESFIVVWIEDQINYNISFSQKTNPEQSPNSLQFCEGGER